MKTRDKLLFRLAGGLALIACAGLAGAGAPSAPDLDPDVDQVVRVSQHSAERIAAVWDQFTGDADFVAATLGDQDDGVVPSEGVACDDDLTVQKRTLALELVEHLSAAGETDLQSFLELQLREPCRTDFSPLLMRNLESWVNERIASSTGVGEAADVLTSGNGRNRALQTRERGQER